MRRHGTLGEVHLPGLRGGAQGGEKESWEDSHRKYCLACQRRCYRMEVKSERCPFILAAGWFMETGHSVMCRIEMGRSKDAGW